MSERGIGLQIMIASTPEEFNELVRLSFLTHSLHASQEKETIIIFQAILDSYSNWSQQ